MIKEWNGPAHKERMRRTIIQALTTIALMIEREAKRLCPVDTGRLRASITIHVDKNRLIGYVIAGGNVDEAQVHSKRGRAIAGTNVLYAIFVEQGTWKMEAQPYLRPALEKLRPQIMAILKAAYKRAA